MRTLQALATVWLLTVSAASAAPIIPTFNAVFPARPTGWVIGTGSEWAITGGGPESYVTFDEPLTGVLEFRFRHSVNSVNYFIQQNGRTTFRLPNTNGDPSFPDRARYFASFQRPGQIEFLYPETFPYFSQGVTARLYVTSLTELGFGLNVSRSPETMQVATAMDFTPVAPIPEPGTIVLVGSMLAAGAWRRLRREATGRRTSL